MTFLYLKNESKSKKMTMSVWCGVGRVLKKRYSEAEGRDSENKWCSQKDTEIEVGEKRKKEQNNNNNNKRLTERVKS